MFEFLFNEPLAVWRDAQLVWTGGWGLGLAAAVFAAGVLLLAVTLRQRRLPVPRRLAVGALQALSLGVVLVMLAQPALRVETTDARDNRVAWVLDTSASMKEKPAPEAPDRLARARAALSAGSVLDSDTFASTRYTFGETLDPVPQFAGLEAAAARTSIAGALDQLLATLDDQSLAAIVLVSDGADNSDALTADWWSGLRSGGVPVYTVGVGAELPPGDVELADVRLPPTATPGTAVQALVRLRHSQAGSALLKVTSAGRLLASERIELAPGRHETAHRFTVPAGAAGVRELVFAVEPGDGETNRLNNRQLRVLNVRAAPRRVLYVEGEPRWEYKFIRRALTERSDIELVSLLRTSANKYYRQGVRDAAELADGFPQRRDRLFSYDAVIIGSLEAAELSQAQQVNLRDFVNQRGGSLLMLAGPAGLADGGWGRTVVEAALPVVLGSRSRSETYRRERTQIVPTGQGLRTPWLALADQPDENRQRWQVLPEVGDLQSVGELRAGAVALLATADAGRPVLAWHRYGQGQSYVLGTGGTWRWQMSMPSDDDSHERFWQQLLAQMVDSAMPRLTLDLGSPVYRDASEARIRLTARNADYSPVDKATLPVEVVFGNGVRQRVELDREMDAAGVYAGSVALAADGAFSVVAQSAPLGESPGQEPPARIQRWASVESGTAEAFAAGQNRDLLERIADVTGGAYLPLDELQRLPGLLAGSPAAVTRELRLPLWNMPALFLLLLGARLLEWLLRLRWRRL